MIEFGFVLMFLGTLAGPIERALGAHRAHRAAQLPPFAVAFPLVAPDPALDALLEMASAEIDRIDLVRGIAAVRGIYDRA